jgi:LysR family transcriptional regulator, low CO2-responsive transcriptional regulator
VKQATLHQLKVFEAAARHKSFTRAAEELYLTQPTVSMQIKQLTKTVGLPLFEQVGRKLYLTEAGCELYNTSQQLFEQLSQFEMTISNLKGLKQGNLRLAVVTTAKYVIPRLLGPFCQQYPGIEVALTVTNHDYLIESLLANRDDLYILSQPPEHQDIACRPFLENPLVVIAPGNHPLAGQKQIPLARLQEEMFIMREPGSGTRRVVQSFFEEHNIPIKVRLELGSNEAIKQAIAGGLGISVLSRHTLRLDSDNKELVVLDVEGFPILRHWYVIHLASKHLSVVSQTFLDYLLNEGKDIAQRTTWQEHALKP